MSIKQIGLSARLGPKFDIESQVGDHVMRIDQSRAGFGGLRVRVKMDADLSQSEKEALLHEIHGRCPISDNLLHATPLEMVAA